MLDQSQPMIAAPNGTKGGRSGTFTGGNGRRLVSTQEPEANDAADEAQEAPVKRSKPKTMEDLDRIVEEDELDLINVKRDIKANQKHEISNQQRRLMVLKKQHDNLHSDNNAREKTCKNLLDKVLMFKNIDTAVNEAKLQTDQMCKDLNMKKASVEESGNAEQRTLNMQLLMKKRLGKNHYSPISHPTPSL